MLNLARIAKHADSRIHTGLFEPRGACVIAGGERLFFNCKKPKNYPRMQHFGAFARFLEGK